LQGLFDIPVSENSTNILGIFGGVIISLMGAYKSYQWSVKGNVPSKNTYISYPYFGTKQLKKVSDILFLRYEDGKNDSLKLYKGLNNIDFILADIQIEQWMDINQPSRAYSAKGMSGGEWANQQKRGTFPEMIPDLQRGQRITGTLIEDKVHGEGRIGSNEIFCVRKKSEGVDIYDVFKPAQKMRFTLLGGGEEFIEKDASFPSGVYSGQIAYYEDYFDLLWCLPSHFMEELIQHLRRSPNTTFKVSCALVSYSDNYICGDRGELIIEEGVNCPITRISVTEKIMGGFSGDNSCKVSGELNGLSDERT